MLSSYKLTASKKDDVIVGKHVYGNLYGCDARLMADEKYIRRLVREAVDIAKMHLVELKSWRFSSKKGGISVIALVTESHVAVHTWPDYQYATVDVYTCGQESQPEKAFEHIVKGLAPREYTKHFADRSSVTFRTVTVREKT
ncbi:MAG: adenosylmethionine decarboxylase [Candidatus Terraquivivens tikiterensis]|uniref:S-adenosylmethionine decarboxylase proenzyme n=1 Tax=Candidatus Terraquivivens tikiterensis TaxID=1980982 RepID=A0A2R7Y302_9ARCH|nr:MAG: adenosylmethionine decarboxylase [Candidatus Terraquivivens tikiterensis]